MGRQRTLDKDVELGLDLIEQGQLDRANTLFRSVLDQDIEHPGALHGMGLVAREMRRYDVGAELIRRAIAKQPRNAQFQNNLGTIHEAAEELEEAIACYGKAARLAPKNPAGHNNLGSILAKQGRYGKAVQHFGRALRLAPNDPGILTNYATSLAALGDYRAARPYFEKSLELAPEYATGHYNWSVHMLANGEWREGWRHFEWRFQAPGLKSPKRYFPQPLWNGNPFPGARLILWAEQGIGDEIRYASMVPDVLDRGGQVVIECEARLVSLFQRSFPDAEVVPFRHEEAESGREHFDVHCPFGTLGRLLRSERDAFPIEPGYLRADPDKVTELKGRLAAAGDGPYVGLCWRSGLSGIFRSEYYVDLQRLAPLFEVEGVRFVNLQYDVRQEELTEARERFGRELLHWEDLDLKGDLETAAALTACMDLVISAPTSVACMAGAIGVPSIEFRPVPVSREYFIDGHDPWFPAARLVDKRREEKWTKVFEPLARELAEMCA